MMYQEMCSLLHLCRSMAGVRLSTPKSPKVSPHHHFWPTRTMISSSPSLPLKNDSSSYSISLLWDLSRDCRRRIWTLEPPARQSRPVAWSTSNSLGRHHMVSSFPAQSWGNEKPTNKQSIRMYRKRVVSKILSLKNSEKQDEHDCNPPLAMSSVLT